MPAYHQNDPNRRGIAKTLTLDVDAVELLDALAVGPKGQGKQLSELLRSEMVRREERKKVVELMRQALEAEGAYL